VILSTAPPPCPVLAAANEACKDGATVECAAAWEEVDGLEAGHYTHNCFRLNSNDKWIRYKQRKVPTDNICSCKALGVIFV